MTPQRYTLDTDRARTILVAIERREDIDNGEDATPLTDAERAAIDALGDADIDPGITSLDLYNESLGNRVDDLATLAWYGDLVNGPAQPLLMFMDDADGGSYAWRIDLGEHPATVRLATPTREVRSLADFDLPPADRALDLLETMVGALNAALMEHDNYLRAAARPTHVPERHHGVYVDNALVATFYTDEQSGEGDPVEVIVKAPGDKYLAGIDTYENVALIGTWWDHDDEGEWLTLAEVYTNDLTEYGSTVDPRVR